MKLRVAPLFACPWPVQRRMTLAVWVIVGLCFGTAPGCGAKADSNQTAGTDSNSNWLVGCGKEAECGNGLQCLCGICTQACGKSSECSPAGKQTKCVEFDESDCPEQALSICADEDAARRIRAHQSDSSSDIDRSGVEANEGTGRCDYSADWSPAAYQGREFEPCGVRPAGPLPSGACRAADVAPCTDVHLRECSYDHPEVYDRLEGNNDEWLCDCLGGRWSCWLHAPAASICGETGSDAGGVPDGANCGLEPLPTCDEVFTEIERLTELAQRCEGDEACSVDFDWNCDGEPDRYSVSSMIGPSQTEGLLEVVGCYSAQSCDPFAVSRELQARCVEGRCQLVR